MRSEFRAQFFSLIPFFIESVRLQKLTSDLQRFSQKYYVVKLELFPQAGYLKLHVLRFGGVHELFLPLKQLIPITPYDYWCASWTCFFKQNTLIDLDMIYANHVTKEMFVFGKNGQWHDSGIHHDALSMEKTYNETNWYDEFSANNF